MGADLHRDSRELDILSSKRWRVAAGLTSGMVFSYFGFVLLVAFNKPLMARLPLPGLSLGIILGALVIVSAWVLTFIYVRWANTSYDHKVHGLRARHRGRS